MSDNEARGRVIDAVAKVKPLADFYDHSYISLRDKYFFHTVGKAANSTVKHVFYTLELAERGRKLPSVHDRASSPLMSPYQLDDAILSSILKDEAFTRFTFVRDPYSRLVSCYLDRIADVKSRPHAQLVRAMGKTPGYKPSFAEFIDTICGQTSFQQNNHWRVQYDDALAGLIDYDFVGKQESFAADMDKVMSMVTGKPHENVVGEVNASPSKTSAGKRLAELFTPDLARKVQDRYARDFEHYGYEAEPAWLAPPPPKPVAPPAPAAAAAAPAAKPAAPAARAVPAGPPKRAIRLKEFGPNVTRDVSPTPQYLRHTNGTLEAGEYRLETDEDGFIVAPDYRDRKGPKTYVLGDSFVECSFIQQGNRLCDRMNAHPAMGDGKVFNGGYSGSTSLHAFNTLMAKVVPFGPSDVIYVLPSNDVLSCLLQGGFWTMTDKRYATVLPVPNRPFGSDRFEDNVAALGPVLRMFAQAARAFDFNLTFATMPFVQSDYAQLGWFRIRHKTEDVYRDLMDKRHTANAIMTQVAADEGVRLVDLGASLAPSQYYDDVHLNEAGCVAAADTLVKAIRS